MATTGLYRVTELLNEKFRAEGFNRITFGDPSEVDLNKQGVYPMMHITLSNRVMSRSSEVINMQLIFMDIIYEGKPLDSRTTDNEMSNISNSEDILHDLGYRVNRAYQKFLRDIDIIAEFPDTLTLTAFYAKAQNKLAGYEVSFSMTIQGGDAC